MNFPAESSIELQYCRNGAQWQLETGSGISFVSIPFHPHLLLFTMLPPLIAGDAMTMDTAVARKVCKQWLYLAGPGVC